MITLAVHVALLQLFKQEVELLILQILVLFTEYFVLWMLLYIQSPKAIPQDDIGQIHTCLHISPCFKAQLLSVVPSLASHVPKCGVISSPTPAHQVLGL